MNIINDSNAGGRLGAALGSGIQLLAQQKLNQIVQRQQRAQSNKAFEALGFSPEEASDVSNLPTKLQEKIVLGYLERGGGLQGLQQSQAAPQQQQYFQPQQNNPLQQLVQNQQPRGQMPNYGRSPLSADDAINKLLLSAAAPSGQQEQNMAPLGAPRTSNKILPQAGPTVLQQKQQVALQQPAQQPAQQQMPIEQQAPQRKSIAEVFAQQKESKPADIKLSKTQEAYEKAYYANEEVENTAKEMKDLLKSGKVASGWWSKQLPVEWQNAETQRFDQLSKKIVAYEVSKLGIPTNAKIKFSESAKVNLGQAPEVQAKGIETILKEAAHKKNIARQRLPEGYFGEDVSNEQPMGEALDTDVSVATPASGGPGPEEQQKVNPENENYFARRYREEEEAQAKNPELANKEEGWGDYIVRNLTRLQGTGKQLSGFFVPTEKEVEEKVLNEGNFTPAQKEKLKKISAQEREYLSPKSFTERVVDDVARDLPISILTAGGSLPTLGKLLAGSTGGSVASEAAKSAGMGAASQILAGMVGSIGTGKIINRIKGLSPENLVSIAKDAEKQAYAKAEKLGSGIEVDGAKYKDSLDNLYKKVEHTSQLTSPDKKELLKKIKQWSEDVGMGQKIPATTILQRKQDINSLYPKYFGKENQPVRKYLEQAQSIMFDKLDDIGKAGHQDWVNAWKEGDAIKTTLNYRPEFIRVLEDNPKIGKIIKNPIAQFLIGGGVGLIKGSPAALISGVATPAGVAATKKIAQIAAFAMHDNKALQRILLEAFKATSGRNVPQILKAYNRLEKATDKYSNLI